MSFTNNNVLYYTTGLGPSDNRTKETWKVNVAVGIKEIETERLEIFPNPAHNRIYLRLSGSVLKNYRITDITGQISLVGTFESSNGIDISSLTPGVYFLALGSHRSKLVIQ